MRSRFFSFLFFSFFNFFSFLSFWVEVCSEVDGGD